MPTSLEDLLRVADLLADAGKLLHGLKADDRQMDLALDLTTSELGRVEKRVADLVTWLKSQQPKQRAPKPKSWISVIEVAMTVNVGVDFQEMLIAWVAARGGRPVLSAAVQLAVDELSRRLMDEHLARDSEEAEARKLAEFGPNWRDRMMPHNPQPPQEKKWGDTW